MTKNNVGNTKTARFVIFKEAFSQLITSITAFFSSLFAEIKDDFGSLRPDISAFFGTGISELKALPHEISDKADKKRLRSFVIYIILINLAVSLYSTIREGKYDDFMAVFSSCVLAGCLIAAYAWLKDAPSGIMIAIVFLFTLGVFFMVYSYGDSSYAIDEGGTMVKAGFTGAILAIIGIPFLNSFSHSFRSLVKVILLFTAAVVLYAMLFVFGVSHSGTKAWIGIAGHEFQLTEVTKLLALITFSEISVSGLSEKEKSLWFFCSYLLNAAALCAVNELGTLLIISIVYLLLRIVFSESRKAVLCELGVIALCAALALGFFRIISVSNTEMTVSVVEEEETEDPFFSDAYAMYDALRNPPAEEATQETVSQEEASTAAEVSQTESTPGFMTKLFSRMKLIYPKLKTRMKIYLNKTGDSPSEQAQIDAVIGQVNSAKEALSYITLFGNGSTYVGVPVIRSDYIFLYLIIRFGIVGSLLAFASIFAILYYGMRSVWRRREDPTHALVFAFATALAVQVIICTAVSLGIFPVVGIPWPFISEGGVSSAVCIFMSLYIVQFINNRKKGEFKI